MAPLVVIVPSRGRPHAVAELAEVFARTCAALTGMLAGSTELWFAVDHDDPRQPEYARAVGDVNSAFRTRGVRLVTVTEPAGTAHSMVGTLNAAARSVLKHSDAEAIAFMGDDHRPRTPGWDTAYLAALEAKPGIVYGDDLIRGADLPTQVAMSACLVRALGHMAPPTLTHLYVDDYWMRLGGAARCLTYLPEVVVEHLHPVAGTAPVDEGYRRVNAASMYTRDRRAFADYWAERGPEDVALARWAVGV